MCSALHRSGWSQLPIPRLILLFHFIHTFSLVWKESQEGCYTKKTANQKLALMQFPLPASRSTANDHRSNLCPFFSKDHRTGYWQRRRISMELTSSLVSEVKAGEFLCHATFLEFWLWPFVACLTLMLAPESWTAWQALPMQIAVRELM